MLRDLTADADLRGRRIDLEWGWSDPAERPLFRLLRSRRAYPAGVDRGYPVVQLDRLFGPLPTTPWVRTSQMEFLSEDSTAEGGLRQAVLHFGWGAGAEPERVEVERWNPGTESIQTDVVAGVTRVEVTTGASATWGQTQELEIFHDPGGGEVSAGIFRVLTDHTDGVTPDTLEWEPDGAPVLILSFDRTRVEQASPEIDADGPLELTVRWNRVRRLDEAELATALSDPLGVSPDQLVTTAILRLDDRFSADTGEWTRSLHISDLTPVPEQTSYYRLFRQDSLDPALWTGDVRWRSRATATAPHGFPDLLYQRLPAQHRTWDEPTPESRGGGQLRRFMEVFGTGLDHLRSSAVALQSRHDVDQARDDLLPALGDWIGWATDRTAPLQAQRDDIQFAPRIYRTVGTVPTLEALVSRSTGWVCRAKEYVHNVCLTNAPETIPIWEIFTRVHDGTDFGPATRLTEVEGFEGRPATVRDSGGDPWLVWHSDRSGRRELWFQRLDGVDPVARRVMDGASDDLPGAEFADLSPTLIADGPEVLLFWESSREGRWDIWSRRLTGAGASDPEALTDHPAQDRQPAVARDAGGDLWLFWRSDRRGVSDIWARHHDGASWGPPTRLTGGTASDADPAAALDSAGRLWLIWRRDEGGSSRLWARVRDAGSWSAEAPVEPTSPVSRRDESPSLVARGPELWLLWHSNRGGAWELWGATHDGTDWSAAFQVTEDPDGDKEPVALVDGGDVRLFWRSGRAARRHRSRTVDTTDLDALDRLGSFDDGLHYTYDTGRENPDRYARDTVGLFLAAEPASPEEFASAVAVARSYIEPFRPVNTRLVWIPEGASSEELIDIDNLLVDDFDDEIN